MAFRGVVVLGVWRSGVWWCLGMVFMGMVVPRYGVHGCGSIGMSWYRPVIPTTEKWTPRSN